MLTVNITYSDIISQCKMLSSYEGANNVSGSGESLFLDTKIATQDEPLIKSLTKDCLTLLEGKLGNKVVDSKSDDAQVTWILDQGARNVELDDVARSIKEPVVMYVMWQWCIDRKPSAVDKYKDGWESMAASAIHTLNKKSKPSNIFA